MDEPIIGRTIQSEVLKRFMSDEEFAKFVETYKQNRRGGMGKTPLQELVKTPATPEEMNLLFWFFDATNEEINARAKSEELTKQAFMDRLKKTAMRIVFANKDALSF